MATRRTRSRKPDESSDAAAPAVTPRPAVVGIVASAGGVEALRRFVQALQPGSGLSYVVVPHLDPHHDSAMREVLAAVAGVPVSEIRDGDPIEVDHVHVIPPNQQLSLHAGTLRLGVLGAGEIALDPFLQSLARARQESAIAIVLSGSGRYGCAGAKAVKSAGGLVLAQAPDSAEHPAMPQSVIDAGIADFVLAPEQMPAALADYARVFLDGAEPEQAISAAEADHFAQILDLVRNRTRCDFRAYRKRMVLRRVQRRMGLNRLDNLGSYLTQLNQHPDEVKLLARDLLICVTGFMRDAEMFEVLEKQVIPDLVRNRPTDAPLRIWVPACATGEEAYSLAILFSEAIARSGKAIPLQVFATDIEVDALEVARHGIYADAALQEISPERRSRFFTRVDESHHQVNRSLRDAVLFAQQNILGDAPFSKIDLVSCRNLLIYLEPDVQQKVIALLHFALADAGTLVLGPSETVAPHVDLFEPVSKKWRIYRRVGTHSRSRAEFPIQSVGGRSDPRPIHAPTTTRPVPLADAVRDALLHDYAPASVLIRRNYEVLYFHGATDLYLKQPSGQPTQDLIALARDGLRERIHAAVHKAARQNRRVSIEGAQLKRHGRFVQVRVNARPLQDAPGLDGALLVSFEDVPATPSEAERRRRIETDCEAVARQLERELHATRDALQSTIEELESANEELKASNEEVMSMNEELQSANEELETSKEELQSLNEELSTVNNQLQEKLDLLEAANNDMSNLLASTDTPTLFLAPDHCIKRFTSAATRLFSLIPSDAGRPLRDISRRFIDVELEPDVEAVLHTLAPREKEIRTEDGSCYLRRITPYRTADNRIEGVVVAFTDISAQVQAAAALREINSELEQRVVARTLELTAERNFVTAVLETAASVIAVLDRDGRIVRINRAAEKVGAISAAAVQGRRFWEIGLVPDDELDDVRRAFAKLSAGQFPAHHENHWRRPDGSLRRIYWTNTCLVDDQGEVEFIIGTGIDITEQVRNEQLARQRQSELAHVHRFMTAGELAAALAHELNQPLAAIASYSEAGLQKLQRAGSDALGLRRPLHEIAQQAQRAGKAVGELRGFLSRGEEARVPTDINLVIHAACSLVTGGAQAQGVEIRLALGRNLPQVRACAVHIEHVLVNLIQNGIESIRAAGKPGGAIAVSSRRAGKRAVVVSVHDNGPGVDPNSSARLFEPFYTTKPDGMGMGLAICRRIIDDHDGRLWVESTPGNGATFHFSLPVIT